MTESNVNPDVLSQAAAITDVTHYSEGSYYRVGKRVYYTGENPPPGWRIKPETVRQEFYAFRNLVTGDGKPAHSVEVEGWQDRVVVAERDPSPIGYPVSSANFSEPSSNDTPLTDALLARQVNETEYAKGDHWFEMTDHARKLERKLVSIQAVLIAAQEVSDCACDPFKDTECDDMLAERATIIRLREALDAHTKEKQ